MKGPAGYGRYDNDLSFVGCPWARSDMSPCVARDGQQALIPDPVPVCAGCANTPEYLIEDLAEEYGPARQLQAETGDPQAAADKFAQVIREATEPAGQGS